MDTPANTISYFAAGYVVIFGVLIFYLASLIIRWRNLKQDEALLSELERKEEPLNQ
ncbi:MAG: hypothetical protein AB1453_05785 [Chloroflexota bacterium]|jgi:hypothetical protein